MAPVRWGRIGMLVDGLYGPLRLRRGTLQEMVVTLYREYERRRGLYQDLIGALDKLKNPQAVLDGLVRLTVMEKPKAGPSVSQQVAFIRALRKVNWKNIFKVGDTGYADDRAAKAQDPIMKHYI